MARKPLIFGLAGVVVVGAIVVIAQGRAAGPKTTHTTAPAAVARSSKTTATPRAKAKNATAPAAKTQQTTASAASGNKQLAKISPTPAPVATPPSSPMPKALQPAKSAPATMAKPATLPAKSEKAVDTKLAKAEKPAMPATSATPATATTDLTPVQEKLKQNANLTAKVASRLPQGTDLMAAAAGFKTLGEFVAAANVSSNLQVSFTELKARIMSGMSLSQAIQAVRPLTASPTIEAQRAQYDARGLIAEAEQNPSSASSTATPAKAAATPSSTTVSRPPSLAWRWNWPNSDSARLLR